MNDADIDLVVVIANKHSINEKCFKYFIGYKNHSEDDITANHINLPKFNWTF